MPRTDLTAISPVSINATIAADAADFAWTAADTSNQNAVVSTGRELVLVFNSGGSAYTVTITSVADELGRLGTITTYSVGAGEYAVFGPFPVKGWRQAADLKLYLEASNAAVKFAVIKLPHIV